MSEKYLGIWLVFMMFIMISCDSQFVEIPCVLTNDVDGIGTNEAVAHGSIIDLGNGVEDHGHCFGIYPNPDIDGDRSSLGKADQIYNYSRKLEGLLPGTTYHIRAYLVSGGETYYGEDISFETYSGEVEVSTDEISNVTATSAKCSATVHSAGGYPLLQQGVIWSKNGTLNLNSYLGLGSSPAKAGPYLVDLSPLDFYAVYYARAFAISTVDTSYGKVMSFQTGDGIVKFGSTYPEDPKANSVKCYSSIADDGKSIVTSRGFCWSQSLHPTIWGDKVECGSGTGEFSGEAVGLKEDKVYYLRAYATNGIDTYYSPTELEIRTAKE